MKYNSERLITCWRISPIISNNWLDCLVSLFASDASWVSTKYEGCSSSTVITLSNILALMRLFEDKLNTVFKASSVCRGNFTLFENSFCKTKGFWTHYLLHMFEEHYQLWTKCMKKIENKTTHNKISYDSRNVEPISQKTYLPVEHSLCPKQLYCNFPKFPSYSSYK